jgi:putative colanic acid biosynthesis acetyltransferase WcaF
LAEHVDCYNVDKVILGTCTTVSQYSYLCTATHDYNDPVIMERPQLPLLIAPITLCDRVWITADVFVGPGVTVHEGSVVLARSSVFKDVPQWSVAAGNPATVIKARILRKLSNS